MTRYRITRYDPKNRNEKGYYAVDTWVSYCDIGKYYEGKALEVQEYLSIEKSYVDAILDILLNMNVEALEIVELDSCFTIEELYKELKEWGILLTSKEKKLLKDVVGKKEISLDETRTIIPLILRECLWCKLISRQPECILEFGYDLYTYITCSRIDKPLVKKAKKRGIYIEAMKGEYWIPLG
ncbi:hypothetical protein NE619_13735 [Anaerovorax odorimutans]|uniref:Uncharacterized protein n=1 Tax=Anaerovorax odorimutans TaxID=109327 RepID=A0ABT1RRG5_9FIRM|nr:hypothetical protein [Anaerovorax odorimutans]MCQ4637791.1 hypothetical protein [Anaerovorax odorimutans]